MTWEQAGIVLFAFAIVCELAHVVSPIVRAWAQPELRQIALSRSIETILLPIGAVVGALVAPLWVIFAIYSIWNVYHFGMQHYGVARLCGWRVARWWPVLVTAILMLPELTAPFPQVWALIPGFYKQWWYGWFVLIAIDFNHWLVDIVLSSWALHRYWWLFVPAITIIGCIGFVWEVPRVDHVATLFVPWVIKTRWGVGIVHFLYSRWVWKLSNPRVRATIGHELFA